MRIARRAGMRKAKVALARKLAVILHRMLADATTVQSRWPRGRLRGCGFSQIPGGPRTPGLP